MIVALTIGSQLAHERVDAISTGALLPYLDHSNDDNPLHRDPAVAIGTGFAGVPIPGQLLLAVMERYAKSRTEGYWLKRITVRFVSPVVTDQPFELSGRVVAFHESDKSLVLRLQINQNGQRCVIGEAMISSR